MSFLPLLILLTTSLSLIARVTCGAEARVYPSPPGEILSRDFAVTVNGAQSPVLVARVAPGDAVRRWKAMDDVAHSGDFFDTASFTCFDIRGSADVTVDCPSEILSAKILPDSRGIVPTIRGKRLSFKVLDPANLTLEVNGNTINSLHIFAGPFETDPPRKGDPNVIFFGPGVHDVREGIKVGDGKTVYIAGGAVVRGVGPDGGPVFFLEGRHVALRGRGIIDGSRCPIHSRSLVAVKGEDISLEGVILRDSSVWNMPIRQSDRVSVKNIKVLGCRANSDGIDVCNSRDVAIEDCFLRTLDDLIVVKTDLGQGPARHVVVRNCILWNQVAHALSVGAELRENVDDVRFTDCDIIHDSGREWAMRVFHADGATVSHVRFENIRCEESRKLISLWIGKTLWSRDAERGHIENVTFKNVQAFGGHPLIELQGFDTDHAVDGVSFQDVRIDGKPITRANIAANEFVRNTVVQP